jgi:hypothetical protein
MRIRPQALTSAQRQGVGVALATLVFVDAVPGISFTRGTGLLPGASRLDLVLLGVIIPWLVYEGAQEGFRTLRQRRSGRLLVGWGCLLALWWLITWMRSYVFEDIPADQAWLYATDFLYYAFLPALFFTVLARPGVLRTAGTILGVAATFLAAVVIVAVTSSNTINFFLHVGLSNSDFGLLRLYAPCNELITASLPIAIGVALAARDGATRRRATLLAGLAAVAVVLQLTRAVYLGMTVGLIVALAIWVSSRSPGSAVARRRVLLALVGSVVMIAVAVNYSPGGVGKTAISGVTKRLTSGVTAVNDASDTVAYRTRLLQRMKQHLDGHWVAGLGFLNPRSRYVVDLPLGSIRNPDVGIFNVLMTMGLIGAALLYIPVLYLLARVVMTSRMAIPDVRRAGLAFGFTAWGTHVLITSPTLGLLTSKSGICLTSVVLAAVAASLPLRREHEASGAPAAG